jgi:cbb3-type cytochrome oxidase subunit 3
MAYFAPFTAAQGANNLWGGAMNFWATVFIVIFFLGAIGWLWWAISRAPDLTELDAEAHAEYLKERQAKKRITSNITSGTGWVLGIDGGPRDSAMISMPEYKRSGWITVFRDYERPCFSAGLQIEIDVLGWQEDAELAANQVVTVLVYRTKDGARGVVLLRYEYPQRNLVKKPQLVWENF